jgi:uncharacterized protein (DUF1330 family)
MAYERIMGIDVTDDVEYQKYRAAMTPLLHAAGGDFGYDFKVAEVLKSKTEGKINRVFTIDFPSETVMNDFFASDSYVAVKEKYFDSSVGSKTIISLNEK